MAYAIRTTFQLQKLNTENDSVYIKQLYVKNKNWNPDPAPIHIKENITKFVKRLKEEQKMPSLYISQQKPTQFNLFKVHYTATPQNKQEPNH
jgi:hypothetical protein